jgi:hypothetical protein
VRLRQGANTVTRSQLQLQSRNQSTANVNSNEARFASHYKLVFCFGVKTPINIYPPFWMATTGLFVTALPAFIEDLGGLGCVASPILKQRRMTLTVLPAAQKDEEEEPEAHLSPRLHL